MDRFTMMLIGATALLISAATAPSHADTPKAATTAAPAPVAKVASADEIKPGALANTIAFAITDQKKQPVLTIMGDGRIGPNPNWGEVCQAMSQVKATQTNYATLALIKALVAGYSKPCN